MELNKYLDVAPEVAKAIEGRLTAQGVELRFGCAMDGARETGTGLLCHMTDGSETPADIVVLCIGTRANTALVELMALDFAIDELGLYLTTHAQDQEALQLYWSYIKLAKEGREKYQKMYGPLLQTDLTPEDGFAWLKDPWPWEEGGND